MLRKRRYGRLTKAMGDVALLAGSPNDALEHYATASELARTSGDFVWAGAAFEGLAQSRVRIRAHLASPGYCVARVVRFERRPVALLSRGLFNALRVGESQAKLHPRKLMEAIESLKWKRGFALGGDAVSKGEAQTLIVEKLDKQVLATCLSTGAMRSGSPPPRQQSPRHPRLALLQAEETASLHSHASARSASGFGGSQFWAALRSSGIEPDVRALFSEARAMFRRRGAVPLQVAGLPSLSPVPQLFLGTGHVYAWPPVLPMFAFHIMLSMFFCSYPASSLRPAWKPQHLS